MSVFIDQLNVLNVLEETNWIIVDTPSETYRTSLQTLRAYLAGVKTVNGQSPDGGGNINLTPDQISDIASSKKFLTSAQAELVNALTKSGSGINFLADDGTYKPIEIDPPDLTPFIKSVNGQTPDEDGAVTITPDLINDSSSAKKFVSASEKSLIALIQDGGAGSSFLSDDGTYKTITPPDLTPFIKTINGKTPDSGGAVSFTPDDLSDATTTNKFVTEAQKTLINLIRNDAGGENFLAGDGSYKPVALGQEILKDPEFTRHNNLITNADVKGVGQVTLTNGSKSVVGIDTNFLDASLGTGLSYWWSFWVKDSAGNWYRIFLSNIVDDQTATIDVCWSETQWTTYNNSHGGSFANKGLASSTFAGESGTYDFYIVKNFAKGVFSKSFGNNSYVGDYGSAFGGGSVVLATAAAAFGSDHFVHADSWGGFVAGSRNTVRGYAAFTVGSSNLNEGDYGVTLGYRAITQADGAFTGGLGAVGSNLWIRTSSTGTAAFTFSRAVTTPVTNNGEEAVILGGRDHQIPSTSPRAAIIGGNKIVARGDTPDQVYVQKFSVGGGKSGAVAIEFWNAFISTLSWTPTAARTVTIPDANGEVLLFDRTKHTLITTADTGSTATGNFAINFGNNTQLSGSWALTLAEEAVVRGGNSFSVGWAHEVGDGVYGFSGDATLTFGTDNKNNGIASYAGGVGARVNPISASQRGGFVHSMHEGSIDGKKNSAVPYVTVNDGAGAITRNTSAQTDGHGSLGRDGFILGGIDHNIDAASERAAIIGGNAIKVPAGKNDFTHVQKLSIGGGKAGNVVAEFWNEYQSTLNWNATAARVITLPDLSGIIAVIQDFSGKATIAHEWPTDPTGLPSGALWNDAGVLSVVP